MSGTNCSTGDGWIPCRHSLHVQWMNMERRTERAALMTDMFSKLRSDMVTTATRSPAVIVSCPVSAIPETEDGAWTVPVFTNWPGVKSDPNKWFTENCTLETPQYSALDQATLESLERHPDSYTPVQWYRTRAGTMGCYAAHYAALKRYRDLALAPGATDVPEFGMIIEDDIRLDDRFFSETIPRVLAQLHSGTPWDVVRFVIPEFGCLKEVAAERASRNAAYGDDTTCARSYAPDRVGHGQPPVFRAYEAVGARITPYRYMSGSVVMVQRRSVDRVLKHILERGMIDVDVAYKLIRPNLQADTMAFQSFSADAGLDFFDTAMGSSRRDPNEDVWHGQSWSEWRRDNSVLFISLLVGLPLLLCAMVVGACIFCRRKRQEEAQHGLESKPKESNPLLMRKNEARTGGP